MSDNGSAAIAKSLAVLHYVSPVATIVGYLIAKGIATCFLHEASPGSGKGLRRHTTLVICICIAITFVAQGITYMSRASHSPAQEVTQDQVVYTILGSCIFGSFVLGLAENKSPLWHPYATAGLSALVFEIPCAVLRGVARRHHVNYNGIEVLVGYARIVLLVALSAAAIYHAICTRTKSIQLSEETASLLGNGHKQNGSETENGAGYGGVSPAVADETEDEGSDNDEQEDKEIKAEQRRRLKEAGSWLNYLKDFKVFIPMLWPARNRPVQLCILLVIATLVAERFLNVLVPRQLGIVADELTAGWGRGVVPWRSLSTWMLLTWLNSRAGLDLVRSMAQLPIQQFAYKSIAVSSFGHIMDLSMDFHNSKNSGELIRAIEQGQHLQGLSEFLFFEVGPMFTDLIVAFVYVYTLFDIYMSLILLGVGIAYIWIGIKTTAWTINQRRQLNTTWRAESKTQNEAINNWQTVSHFNRGKYERDRYGETVDNFTSAERSYFMMYFMGSAASTLVMMGGRLAITGLAAYRIAQGRAPIGHFVTLISYWASIESPLGQVSWSVRRVSTMLTDSERLLQLMKTKSSIVEQPDAKSLVVGAGEVQFQDVEFAYDARKPLVRGISFIAKPGQTIALVGETGGGKSTLLKLLYRYYDVKSGNIRIDGQDIRNVTLDSLRESFGMVPQDPSLFNISIMQNIKYARLDATDEEVMEACRAAAIHDKILTFPDGYKSEVGERGVKLSGGELQRVAIARAILRQPKIVLLDEATSSVDTVTEEQIQRAFRKLTHERTTFVIAHRLSTIQDADQILVISDGRIIEHGTHEELLGLNGKYVSLWSKQANRDSSDPNSHASSSTETEGKS